MGLKPHEVAALLGLSLDELTRLRDTGQGPPWMVVGGGLVRYDDGEVHEWLTGQCDELAGLGRVVDE